MASVSTNDMRYLVRNVYKVPSWRYKVDKMKDGQVIAIYYSFVKRGLIK